MFSSDAIWKAADRVTIVATLLAALMVVWIYARPQSPVAFNTPAQLVLPNAPLSTDGAPVLGSPGAPYALVVFSDFECPYCATFAREQLPPLKARFVDAGMLSVLFWHVPASSRHPMALAAAELAQCAARRGLFWRAHDELFSRSPQLDIEDLKQVARQVHLDDASLAACRASGIPATVQGFATRAAQLGVASTPTLLLSRRLDEHRIEGIRWLVGTNESKELPTVIGELVGRDVRRRPGEEVRR